jgi:hypothetical protein
MTYSFYRDIRNHSHTPPIFLSSLVFRDEFLRLNWAFDHLHGMAKMHMLIFRTLTATSILLFSSLPVKRKNSCIQVAVYKASNVFGSVAAVNSLVLSCIPKCPPVLIRCFTAEGFKLQCLENIVTSPFIAPFFNSETSRS